MDVTDNMVAYIVQRLSGAVGRGVSYSFILQHLSLWFGAASSELQKIVGEFGDWMAIGRPPLAAYKVLMSGRLIDLVK